MSTSAQTRSDCQLTTMEAIKERLAICSVALKVLSLRLRRSASSCMRNSRPELA